MANDADKSRSKWLLGPISLGLAALLDVVITIEWSFPYCNHPDDGPGWAVYGVIPYERFSGVSSMVYVFHPTSFAANLALLWAICAAGVFLAYTRTQLLVRPWTFRIVAILGVTSAGLIGAYRMFLYHLDLWVPTRSAVDDNPYYTHLRPVGLSVGHRAYACTPSQF